MKRSVTDTFKVIMEMWKTQVYEKGLHKIKYSEDMQWADEAIAIANIAKYDKNCYNNIWSNKNAQGFKAYIYMIRKEVERMRKMSYVNSRYCMTELMKYLKTLKEASESSAMTEMFWKWGETKIIYNFEEDIEKDLIYNNNIDMEMSMPIDLLDYLPHESFFIATPELNNLEFKNSLIKTMRKNLIDDSKEVESVLKEKASVIEQKTRIEGFFFNKDKDFKIKDNTILDNGIFYSISLLMAYEDETMLWTPTQRFVLNNIPKNKECTIKETVDSNEFLTELDELILKNILPYVFYLCSENAVIRERKMSKQCRRLIKKLDNKADNPTVQVVSKPYDVDNRNIEDFIPEFITITDKHGDNEGKRSCKCPHERRSHWHRFWTGKKGTEDRKLILKWVSAMKIHADKFENCKPTETSVLNNKRF